MEYTRRRLGRTFQAGVMTPVKNEEGSHLAPPGKLAPTEHASWGEMKSDSRLRSGNPGHLGKHMDSGWGVAREVRSDCLHRNSLELKDRGLFFRNPSNLTEVGPLHLPKPWKAGRN